ncbi:MAG: YkgJ family cysteine cluster protein [Proteobacteria bacterium]|jgi:Fe-S-cluster containining protein|nr:YkgJ family cysteine cluster protein [Pseudomonadota bacterium]
MSQEKVVLLGPLRHRCYACGKCCYGITPGLVDEEEEERIKRHSATLGIENPVEDGAVRFKDGECVLLDSRRLCLVHGEFGLMEKPRRCREFPVKALVTESGEIRAGIDPSCVNTWRSWRDGEIQDLGSPILRKSSLSPPDVAAESLLIRASAQPGMTVGAMLHLLAGQGKGGPGLPDGFARRLILRLQQSRFRQFIGHVEIGWGMEQPLEHLPDAIERLDPDNPPEWPVLDAEAEAFSLEIMRRMLFLRYATLTPASQGQALLVLSGAVACAWADPTFPRFGESLSAWSRATRFRALWLRLLPDPQTLMWLATGREIPT